MLISSAKIEGALQKLDETAYWLELPDRSGLVPKGHFSAIERESNELVAILVSIGRKLNRRKML
jgi:four helix bundle protein